LSDLPCPEWKQPEPPEKLAAIARGADAIFQFIQRHNPQRYLLGHGDLKVWHGKLFKDAVPVSYYAGRYRSNDPARPCLNRDVNVGSVNGAPFDQVGDLMSKFSDQMRLYTQHTDDFCDRQTSAVLRLKSAAQMAAFAATQIIHIHPFLNGNGRIARMTSNFFFNRYGFRMPFYVERPAPDTEYGPASQYAMATGDPAHLYQYFVTLMASS
jgi:fido (protein-threonine AMPylation protein)